MKRYFILLNVFVMVFGLSVSTYAAIPSNGLVAEWTFDGNANDTSGNANNGTVNGATLTTDRFGNANSAYSFDGVDDHIVVPEDNSLDFSNDLTITAWIKSNNTSGARAIVTKWNDNTGEWSYIFKDHNFNDRLRMTLSSGAWPGFADLPSTSSIPLGQWTFVATTYDSSILKLYFNGVEDADLPVSGTINNSNTELLIGGTFSLGIIRELFDGVLDNIRMYNRVLSNSELQELFQEGVKVFSTFNIIEAKVKFKDTPNYDEFKIKGEFVLGDGNNGINPILEDVAVNVGTSSIVIPAPYAFVEDKAGVFKYKGTINSTDVEIEIKTKDYVTYSFVVKVKGTDLTDTSNPVDVGLTIGDDTGTANVRLKGELMFEKQ